VLLLRTLLVEIEVKSEEVGNAKRTEEGVEEEGGGRNKKKVGEGETKSLRKRKEAQTKDGRRTFTKFL
jgi:hypothetical protein